jgi:hypothetical protein
MSETTSMGSTNEPSPTMAPPAWAAVPPPEPRSPRLGRSALVLAIGVFVFSAVASILIGCFGSTVFEHHTATSAGFNAQPNLLASLVQIVLGTLVGVTALVLGVIAVVQKRGRGLGIAAIIVAAIAPLASLLLWMALALAVAPHVTV